MAERDLGGTDMPSAGLRVQDGRYVWAANPLVIVISGPSGAGKDTVIAELRRQQDSLHFVVTATSRPRRDHEQEGIDYYFFSREEFERRIEAGEFIEHAEVYRDLKGVLKRELSVALAGGKDVVMRVDVQGARRLRELMPEAVFIFIMADSEEELLRRLHGRGSEDEESLQERLTKLRDEVACLPEFDYVVINRHGALDESVSTLKSIIVAEKVRVHQRRASVA